MRYAISAILLLAVIMIAGCLGQSGVTSANGSFDKQYRIGVYSNNSTSCEMFTLNTIQTQHAYVVNYSGNWSGATATATFYGSLDNTNWFSMSSVSGNSTTYTTVVDKPLLYVCFTVTGWTANTSLANMTINYVGTSGADVQEYASGFANPVKTNLSMVGYDIEANGASFIGLEVHNGVSTGLSTDLDDGRTVMIDGYISSPFISIGQYQNYLLQTEVFGTTWVATGNTSAPGANTAYAPTGALLAEWVNGNVSDATVRQTITNATVGNWTFSVWLKGNDSTQRTISLNINSSNETKDAKSIVIGRQWQRYYVTQELTNTHTTKTVFINIGTNNVSMWGAQLVPGITPRPYSGPRTTSTLTALTSIMFTPQAFTATGAITSSGAGTFVGVAAGGALTGATTGAFSGIITQSTASLLNESYTPGLSIVSSTAAGNSITNITRNSPTMRMTAVAWNTTASTSNSMEIYTDTENCNTTSVSPKLVFKTYQIGNIVLNRTLMTINSTGVISVIANDNASQRMCLNVSEGGTVSAYKC